MLESIDHQLTLLFAGSSFMTALLLSFVLGLRHATDPDHLVAVTTLLAGADDQHSVRRARRLGTAWGVGHGITLLAFGLPVVLFRAVLPERVQQAAEAGIGVLIAVLAVRLLMRWRRGHYHLHPHEHGAADEGRPHMHLHSHRDSGATRHAAGHHVTRGARQSLVLGLAHGMGGSAGVALLLVAAIPDRTSAAIAVCVLAVGTAVSMTWITSLLGRLFSHPRMRPSLHRCIPAAGVASCAFGVWYAAAAYGISLAG